ncbi:PDZ domain-containing protein [bacterium]|nr:PDZ domain-containing protein [bacterium]
MRQIRSITTISMVLVLFLTSIVSISADWKKDIDELLNTSDETTQKSLIQKIEKNAPPWTALSLYLQNPVFNQPEKTGEYIEKMIMCIDDVERPYIVYIPEGYNADIPTPLLVILHGGVGRENLIEDRITRVDDHEIMQLVKHEKWVALFPFGQKDAVWWDDVGMTNILTQINTVKRDYNVDDNRVWMHGFSDGASASFMFAMTNPNYFGAFVALNGHMGVAALDGELTTCPANMFNTPLHAVCTDKDSLYPLKKMRPTIKMAIDAGANISYREYLGFGHDFGYANSELPIIGRFLKNNPRNPFPSQVYCESVGPELGWMRWLRIDSIDPGEKAEWHKNYNTPLVDDRITFGFFIDDKYDGDGIRVKNLAEGAVFARKAGLQAEDIIIQCEDLPILSDDDLWTVKQKLKRGDDVTLKVLRDGKSIQLKGKLPLPTHYLLLPQRQPTGALQAQYMANTFELKNSQVKKFSIFIHPDMAQVKQPVRVIVNGVEIFNKSIEADLSLILINFLEHRDRALLYINRIEIDLSNK